MTLVDIAALVGALALAVGVGGGFGTLLVFALIREVTRKPK